MRRLPCGLPQAIVGSLVAKTLSSASAAGIYGAQRVTPPPVAFDVFSVQVRLPLGLWLPLGAAMAAAMAATAAAVGAAAAADTPGPHCGCDQQTHSPNWCLRAGSHQAKGRRASPCHRVVPLPCRPVPTPSWRTLRACCSGGKPNPVLWGREGVV